MIDMVDLAKPASGRVKADVLRRAFIDSGLIVKGLAWTCTMVCGGSAATNHIVESLTNH
jgi:hypothetical protein